MLASQRLFAFINLLGREGELGLYAPWPWVASPGAARSVSFDVLHSHRSPGETLSQRSLHERVQIAIENVSGGARDVSRAKVFHYLIGLEHIRAYLVAPSDVGLRRGVRTGLLFKRLDLPLIEPGAQHVPGGRPVLVL